MCAELSHKAYASNRFTVYSMGSLLNTPQKLYLKVVFTDQSPDNQLPSNNLMAYFSEKNTGLTHPGTIRSVTLTQ